MGRIIKGTSCDIRIGEPEIYVDNAARNRSGHMSHAMIEYVPNHILAFNSNCSPKRCAGHAAYGWIEYRRSADGGKTWSEIFELPFARQAFLDGMFTVSVEKAVACDDGTIVAFCLRNSPYHEACCEPWLTPMYVISLDGGKTWTEEKELAQYKGRIYDARYHEGCIYVLEFCNDAEIGFTGNKPEHVYRIFKSDDNGLCFKELCVVPINGTGRGYGSMLFRPDGSLIVYAYNINDEFNIDYVISPDKGQTWEKAQTSPVKRGIRNPQTAILGNTYFLHGRGAITDTAFVLYTSTDGIHWDDGHLLAPERPACYYSNNLVVHDGNSPAHLLIQYSETYRECCVNVMHIRLECLDV